MRVNSDLMQISGCDSHSSQNPFLEEHQLFRLTLFTNLVQSDICTTIHVLSGSAVEDSNSVWVIHRTEFSALTQQPPQVCGDLTSVDRKDEVCVATLTKFLIFCLHIRALPLSCATFPVVPISLSVKKELLPAEAASLLVYFLSLVITYPSLWSHLRKYSAFLYIFRWF